jgi:MFS family permease
MAEAGTRTRAGSLWTPAFALLCLTVLLGYAHHSLLVPAIPLFVADKGGSALLAGLALLAFSVPSFVLRPWVGEAADRWSAVGVLAVGLLLLVSGVLLYLVPFLAMVFVGSALRGLGWAGVNTGGYTLLAISAPPTRRGEASGYYASITAGATIFFPAVALWLIDASFAGFTAVFLLAAALAFLGVLLSAFVLRPLASPSQPAAQAAAAPSVPSTSGMFDRGVLLATALNLGSALVSPAVIGFLPLYARELGIGNVALFYIIAGFTSIVIRPLLGRQSDRIGRAPAIAFSFLSIMVGLLFIATAQNLLMILVGGVFTSLGSAINGSSTTALAMDLANPASRGRAMATFSLSFQLGAGAGALLAGGMADLAGFRAMYVGAIAIVTAALVLLLLKWKALARTEAVTN